MSCAVPAVAIVASAADDHAERGVLAKVPARRMPELIRMRLVIFAALLFFIVSPLAVFAQGSLTEGVKHPGTIDSPGDMDSWTFQATKGQTLMVSLRESDGGAQPKPQIRVFSPDGQEIGRRDDKPVSRVIAQAPLTGTYTVVVSAGGEASDETGAYVLRRIRPFKPILAVVIFVALFAIATIRNIHFGVLMIPAACAVGVWLAGMSVGDVVDGFPINILILVAAVTYLFAIAQANGTIDRFIQRVLTAVGSRQGLLPYVIYLITTGVASMGSSQAGYVMIPLAMPAAMRAGVNPMVMAVALNSGMSTGGFAPTSLFGSITLDAAKSAHIALSRLALLAVAMVANVALLMAATWIFPRAHATIARRDDITALPPTIASTRFDSNHMVTVVPPTIAGARFDAHHIVTLVCIVCLMLTITTCFALQAARVYYGLTSIPAFTPNIGVITFGFAAALALMYPQVGAEAVRRIDWSTAFMVGGIITFVAVLQWLDADYLLGYAAMNVGTPLVAAFVICMIAGLVSAFASTTGILAALVPIAVPLAGSGGVEGWALLSAMAVCAAIVDASPFSTTGALIVATAAEDERPRLKSLLTRWGLSMVIVGPAAAVLFLLLLGRS